MARGISALIVALLLCTTLAAPAAVAAAPPFPDSIALPDGFYPEGIAVGKGHAFYVGSLLDGAVYRGDLRTGEGAVLADGAEGRVVAGLSYDERSGILWGVGAEGDTPTVFGFDGATGDVLAEVPVPGVALLSAFLNDVVVTRDAVYVTDSFAAVLWTFSLDAHGLPAGPAVAVPLSGDFTFVGPDDVPPGELPINLNGIAATPNGKALLANHSSLGVVYHIDPSTGVATAIDLAGASVPSGDGIVLHGKTLYVVQNFLNQVAVVELDAGLLSGDLTRTISSEAFRVPTTAARFGNRLYLVNARFDEAFPPIFGAPPAMLEYHVVAVSR